MDLVFVSLIYADLSRFVLNYKLNRFTVDLKIIIKVKFLYGTYNANP